MGCNFGKFAAVISVTKEQFNLPQKKNPIFTCSFRLHSGSVKQTEKKLKKSSVE